MAVSVKRCLLLGLLLAAGVAGAQEVDPTRPPAAWQGGAAAPTVLQSVILPRNGKPAAFINGERVELGGRLGDAQVVNITESEVQLKGAEGVWTLRMAPAVDKKPSPTPRSPAKPGTTRPG